MYEHILDFHAHVFPEAIEGKAIENLERHYSLKVQCHARVEDLLESAREGGVERVVVHATATKPDQVEDVNTWIASITNDRIIGFGTLHPDYPYYEKELDRIEELGLKGIKLHPDFQRFDIDDRRMMPIYKAIGSRFPILMHMGDEKLEYSRPEKLARVIDKFPDLTIIAAHLGGYCSWVEALRYLIGRNIYIDTSSSLWRMSSRDATDIILAHGVDRVLFGTDFPITSHKDDLNRFMKLGLTDDEREKILYKNAYKLLHISH